MAGAADTAAAAIAERHRPARNGGTGLSAPAVGTSGAPNPTLREHSIQQPNGNSFGAAGVPAMADLIRFGRRVPLPSSVQILHDLLAIGRNEKAPPPIGGPKIAAKAPPERETSASTLVDPPKAF
jgi:hypothetical protein